MYCRIGVPQDLDAVVQNIIFKSVKHRLNTIAQFEGNLIHFKTPLHVMFLKFNLYRVIILFLGYNKINMITMDYLN